MGAGHLISVRAFGEADMRRRDFLIGLGAAARRFMAAPKAQETASYRFKPALGKAQPCPLWVISGQNIRGQNSDLCAIVESGHAATRTGNIKTIFVLPQLFPPSSRE
jgi:hypothetical protein